MKINLAQPLDLGVQWIDLVVRKEMASKTEIISATEDRTREKNKIVTTIETPNWEFFFAPTQLSIPLNPYTQNTI